MHRTISEIERLLQRSFFYLSKYISTKIDIKNKYETYPHLRYSRSSKYKTLYHAGNNAPIYFFMHFGMNEKNYLIDERSVFDLDTILTHKHIDKNLCLELFKIIKEYFEVLHMRHEWFVGKDYASKIRNYEDITDQEIIIYRNNQLVGSVRINNDINELVSNNSTQGPEFNDIEVALINTIIRDNKKFNKMLVDIKNKLEQFIQPHELLEFI